MVVKVKITKEKLEELYNYKHLSPINISKIYNCSLITIQDRLKKYGITFERIPKNCERCNKEMLLDDNQRFKRYCDKCSIERDKNRCRENWRRKNPPKVIFIKCKRCGKSIIRDKNNKKYCELCISVHKKEERKKYIGEHRDEINQKNRENYHKNRDKILKQQKEWWNKNKERVYIKKEKQKKICPVCNKEFLGKEGQISCSVYCSQRNYAKLHPKPKRDRYRIDNPKRDKVCKFCNVYFRDNSRQNNMECCCEEHSNKHYKKNIFIPRYNKSREINCIFCGIRFVQKRNFTKDIKFCSKDCVINYIRKFDELGYILGVIASDGFITKDKKQMGMTVKDKDYADYFCSCLKKIFPFDKEIKVMNHQDGRVRVYLTKQILIEAISSLFEDKTHTFDWVIPKILYNHTNMIKQFLSGFFDGEATVNTNGKNKYISIQCYSGNEIGLKELAKLLNLFKIEYTLSKLNRKGSVLHNRKLNKSYINNSDIYVVSINKFKSLQNFYDQIGFKIKRKQDKLKHFVENFKYQRKMAWDNQEDEMIKNKSLSSQEVSRLLNITRCMVHNRRKRLGIKFYVRKPLWTEQEENIVKHSNLNNDELAQQLNRTSQAVIQRRHILKK